MSISPVSSSSYAAKNAATATKTSTSPDAVFTLSSKAVDLMQRRQISDEATGQFKDILARANASNAQSAPKAFLNGLSPLEMETLRTVHSLAGSINVSTLTNEGAANLLVQPGSAGFSRRPGQQWADEYRSGQWHHVPAPECAGVFQGRLGFCRRRHVVSRHSHPHDICRGSG